MADGTPIDESTVGRTPLIELDLGVPPTVYAKVEWFNLHAAPHGGGSVKSRIARGMLDAAEASGRLPGRTVIEPTSGNTGAAIARVGAARGYDVEIVMPDNASAGKVDAVRDAGATIHFVDADLGYDAVIERAEEIVDAHPGEYYRPNQYENPANPGTHERTTAPEIWEGTGGEVTHFVAGVGTGGTVTGTGRGLHERGDVAVVGVEPSNALHAVDGLKFLRTGDHYHPGVYDESVLDSKLYVDTGDAYDRARGLRERYADEDPPIRDPGQYDEELVREELRVDTAGGEGFLVGTSCGATVQAARDLAAEGKASEGDTIVLILADRGDRYADVPLWEDLF